MTKRIPVLFSFVGRTNPIMEHASWNHVSSNQLVGDENVPINPLDSIPSVILSRESSTSLSPPWKVPIPPGAGYTTVWEALLHIIRNVVVVNGEAVMSTLMT